MSRITTEEMDKARAAGSSQIMNLCLHCLQHALQNCDPKSLYAGPNGLKPFPYLTFVLQRIREESHPSYVSYSDLFHLSERYPHPGSSADVDCNKYESKPLDYVWCLAAGGDLNNAQIVLDKIWQKHRGKKEFPELEFAKLYAYLGDAKKARRLVSGMSVECLLVLSSYYLKKEMNFTEIFRYLNGNYHNREIPKSRAHIETAILELLLSVEAFSQAWQILERLTLTLDAIPLWVKFEFRTNDASAVLYPYAMRFSEPIWNFSSTILINRALESFHDDIWSTVHAVSGLGYLIKAWGGNHALDEIMSFLSSSQ